MVSLAYLMIALPICFASDLSRCYPPSGQPSCVCQTSHGLIDLTTIAMDNESPKFHNADVSDGTHNYDYNPCYSFVAGDGNCASGITAVCQDKRVLVAIMDTEMMYYDAVGNFELHYSGGDNSRSAIVYLHCDETMNQPRITTTGDKDTTLQYIFHLYTNQTCFNSDSESSSTTAGYIGFIIIFVFLAVLVTYFAVGIIILKFCGKQKGFKIIPNKNFWFSLPFLVKDGIKFVATPCVRKEYQLISGTD